VTFWCRLQGAERDQVSDQFVGGRVVVVTGVTSVEHLSFSGNRRGIWKITDGGPIWLPTGDGRVKTSSVGAIAVSRVASRGDLCGMGKARVIDNASNGEGGYKPSEDSTHFSMTNLPTSTTSCDP
jgi:hypothetical protein